MKQPGIRLACNALVRATRHFPTVIRCRCTACFSVLARRSL
jgi:hypothetical protein